MSELLRLSVTAEGAGLPERALVERMRAIFPSGVEETRDERGRFEVAAYELPPVTLPPELGPWRVEPVAAGRTRTWSEAHHGVTVGGRLWVGPPDEQPAPGLPAVVIAPKRTFGSGAHATTRGCLELLLGLEAPLSVLDLGCGSGVLAVAAARLGHAPVYACDSDPLAVSATRENATANGVAVEAFAADAAVDPLPPADVWLANLLAGPLADVLARPDAPPRVIASGVHDGDDVELGPYRPEQRVAHAGWQALALRRAGR